MKDYYYILGIDVSASPDDVKKAYKKLSIKFHPDKNDGDKFFEDRFKDIQEAYETLSDSNKRQTYNFRYNTFYSTSNKNEYEKTKFPSPKIIDFKANAYSVYDGDQIVITWKTENSSKVWLNCFQGIQSASDSKIVRVSKTTGVDNFKISLYAENSAYEKVESHLNIRCLSKKGQSTSKSPKQQKEVDVNKTRRSFFVPILISFCLIGLVFYLNSSSKNNNTSQNNSSSYPLQKNSVEQPTTPKELIESFLNYIYERDYRKAYNLTDNELWKPYSNFSGDAWGNLTATVINNIEEKKYPSKYGAEHILEVSFSGFDTKKNSNVNLKFDFHIKSVGGVLKIVRMINPRENSTWYEDDPLLEQKDNDELKLYNRPFVLLQAYYDNFARQSLVLNNEKYYSNKLIIHYNDKMISASEAMDKDYLDFDNNNIQSYQVLVNSYEMKTNKYEEFDIVEVPLKYYVTKIDNSKSQFTVNITAVLNKDNDKILAIGPNVTIDKLNAVLSSSSDISKPQIQDEEQYYNPNTFLINGQSPYKHCFNNSNSCSNKCSKIKVIASQGSEVIVLIKQNEKVVRDAYIDRGRTYTMDLPNGTYQAFFYSGSKWNHKKYIKDTDCGPLYGGFENSENYGKGNKEYLNNNLLTYELIEHINGNFSPKTSNKNEAF